MSPWTGGDVGVADQVLQGGVTEPVAEVRCWQVFTGWKTERGKENVLWGGPRSSWMETVMRAGRGVPGVTV